MLTKKTIDTIYDSMPWDEIDAVVFDVGNVLITPGFKDLFNSYRTERAEEIYRLTYRSTYWEMLDYGSMNLNEAIEAMIGNQHSLRDDIEYVMHHWMEFKKLKDEGVNVLRLCKTMGKKLIVLSNYSDNGFSYLEKKFDIFNLFDEIVVSSRIGLIKPDPAIYHYVEDKCDVLPNRTLLIDDKAMNCASALLCGWHAICADVPGKLEQFFLTSCK